ncbi:MAG: hypothetical protein AAF465_08890 [Pseudomonadota bacterium]
MRNSIANRATTHQPLGLLAGLCLLMMGLQACAAEPESPDHRNGEVREQDGYQVWSTELNRWVGPVQFWRTYAAMNGGLTWGERSEYPEYNKVKENDLMIIQVDSGPCLMEFFHRRWRRANDVRRWDPKFNELGGCPNVFD